MNVFLKMKILVTGSDGFIGSHITEKLVRKGYLVRAFTFYNSFGNLGWLEKVPNEVRTDIEIFSGDIRDPNGVKEAMKNCDIVIHLASLIGIPYSYHSPDSYVDTNVKGTLNVLQASRAYDIEQIIHTSTSEVYGSAKFVPITESHQIIGQSPYAATKIAADQLAYSFYSSFDLPITIIRPFNTYGPRQSARAVIPTIIGQIANKNKYIEIGSIYPTRDFSFIDDTTNGFLAAIGRKNTIGETINIGSNFEISIGETIELISELMNSKIPIKESIEKVRPKKSEVNRLFACNKKAKILMDWEPYYAGKDGFKKGLLKTIEWFTNPENKSTIKPNIYNI